MCNALKDHIAKVEDNLQKGNFYDLYKNAFSGFIWNTLKWPIFPPSSKDTLSLSSPVIQ